MVRIFLALSRYGVELSRKRLARHDLAALEDDGGASEDEVDCSGDVAVAVELAVGVRVKSVLESVEGALVVDGEVGA